MNVPPKVSVVMPVYNVADCVAESIVTVQAQSFKSWELIVVNDGSTDATERMVQALASQDTRIRVINQQNAGVAMARNRGLEQALGDYLVFLDGDDLWHQDFLERVVTQLQTTQADLVFCGLDYLEMNGTRRPRIMTFRPEISPASDLIEAFLAGDVLLCMGNVGLRITFRSSYLRFTEGCRHGEDTEYLLRVLVASNFACFLPEPLFLYRVRKGSATRQAWDWRARLDGIQAADRALDHLREQVREIQPFIIDAHQSRVHYSKYRFLYRMVKEGAWKDAQDLLVHKRWKDAVQAVAQRESILHRGKARIVLSGNRLVWRLVWIFGCMKR